MHKKAALSKDFTLVAIGQIISIFGNQILRYALPLYLLNQTGSSALFGTVSAFSFLPMLIMFPIGGIIADRVNKRNIMVVLDFCTALLIFLFYLLVGRIDIVPLMTATLILLYGIQGAYQPAVKASLPALVDADHIMRGNSIVDMINSIASMLGPIAGGLLLSLLGLTPILYVSIACFFASAVMELFIHIPQEKRRAARNIFVTGAQDLHVSFRFMFKEKPVIWKMSLILAATNLFLTSLTLIGMPVIVTQRLGFAPDTANRLYGYAQGAMAAGSVIGGLLAGALSGRLSLRMSPWFLLGAVGSILLMGLALQLLTSSMAIFAVLVFGGCSLLVLSTILQLLIMTQLQRLTPNALLGKVISCVMCVAMCTNPLGQLVYGFVFERIVTTLYLPFYIAGLLMAGIALASRRLFTFNNLS